MATGEVGADHAGSESLPLPFDELAEEEEELPSGGGEGAILGFGGDGCDDAKVS